MEASLVPTLVDKLKIELDEIKVGAGQGEILGRGKIGAKRPPQIVLNSFFSSDKEGHVSVNKSVKLHCSLL